MKLLEIWAWILLCLGIVFYSIGVFGGEFNRQIALFFWGTSIEAMLLLTVSAFCLLLSITVFLIAYCFKKKQAGN